MFCFLNQGNVSKWFSVAFKIWRSAFPNNMEALVVIVPYFFKGVCGTFLENLLYLKGRVVEEIRGLTSAGSLPNWQGWPGWTKPESGTSSRTPTWVTGPLLPDQSQGPASRVAETGHWHCGWPDSIYINNRPCTQSMVYQFAQHWHDSKQPCERTPLALEMRATVRDCTCWGLFVPRGDWIRVYSLRREFQMLRQSITKPGRLNEAAHPTVLGTSARSCVEFMANFLRFGIVC